MANITQHQVFIEQQYGQALFAIIWQQHETLIDQIKQQQKFATRIIAKKLAGNW